VIVVGAIGYAIDRLLDWAETRLIHGRRGAATAPQVQP
jgi:sulfonate transport system permease protein